jgi:hypothetical protein
LFSNTDKNEKILAALVKKVEQDASCLELIKEFANVQDYGEIKRCKCMICDSSGKTLLIYPSDNTFVCLKCNRAGQAIHPNLQFWKPLTSVGGGKNSLQYNIIWYLSITINLLKAPSW